MLLYGGYVGRKQYENRPNNLGLPAAARAEISYDIFYSADCVRCILLLLTRGCSKMAEKQSVRSADKGIRCSLRPIRKLSIGVSNRNRFQLHTSEPGRETRPILVST